ncbi:MAG TPA: hypothetical protein VJ861_11395 [Treponemataceae bacterium]|nr:hypothetical protein [Treponemataceae bacterium]
MKKAKLYAVVKNFKNRETLVVGTIAGITDYFGYTLECGKSWNQKINRNPTTIKSLLGALSKSEKEIRGCCYEQATYRDGAEFLTDVVKEKFFAKALDWNKTYSSDKEAFSYSIIDGVVTQ